jgi:hypothetical protein
MAASLSGPSPLHPSQVFVLQTAFQARDFRLIRYSGLTKAEAEELLDWLDAHGQGPAQLSYSESDGFTVSCR